MKFDYQFYVILAISVLFSLYFLYLIINNLIKSLSSYKREKIKPFKNIITVLLFLVFIFFSSSLIFLYLSLRSYSVLTYEKDVARIKCLNVKDKDSVLNVSLIPIDRSIRKITNRKIRGDLWAVDAYILKWHPLMHYLGFNTQYKVISLYGKYESIEKKRNSKHDVLLLSKNRDNKYWKALMKSDRKLFFIKSVYGSSVFQYPSEIKEFLLKISRTGVTLEKKGDNQR